MKQVNVRVLQRTDLLLATASVNLIKRIYNVENT